MFVGEGLVDGRLMPHEDEVWGLGCPAGPKLRPQPLPAQLPPLGPRPLPVK